MRVALGVLLGIVIGAVAAGVFYAKGGLIIVAGKVWGPDYFELARCWNLVELPRYADVGGGGAKQDVPPSTSFGKPSGNFGPMTTIGGRNIRNEAIVILPPRC